MFRGKRFVVLGAVASLFGAGLVLGPQEGVRAAGIGIAYTVADTSADEGSASTPGVMTFTVTAQGTFFSAETVHFDTANGTAVAGVDYVSASGDLSFSAPGTKTVQVNLIGDSTPEADKNFSLVLSNNPAISDGTAIGTVRNDDWTVSIGDATLVEADTGSTNAAVQISLSSPRPAATTVQYQTANGTAIAGQDYTAASGTATIPANTAATIVNIAVGGDTVYEDDETFTVSLIAPSGGVVVDDGTATVTIQNDDPEPSPDQLPKLSIAGGQTNEGDDGTHTANFAVTLNAATSRTVTVAVGTGDGTAKTPVDYEAKNATITFGPATGPQTKTFSVTINGDTLDEANETLTATLSSPTAASLNEAAKTALMTITDDDAEPVVGVNDAFATEGGKARFTVTLSFASGQDLSVRVVTGAGTATAADFTAFDTLLTIPAGTTSKFVDVQTTQDPLDEDDETFTLTATLPGSDDVGTGTITDDDVALPAGHLITTGAGAGAGSHVRVFDATGAPQAPEGFFPYRDGPGVRVARGDLDADGHDEIVVAPGPGMPVIIQVFSANGAAVIDQVDAYPGFSGGAYVAVGDVDGDGKDEVITSAGSGGGPHVRTFTLVGPPGNRSLQGAAGFFGARTDFTGGLTVAAGDVNGDNADEIILGVARGDQPIVSVWNYNPTTNVASQRSNPFLAYAPSFFGGISVAAGDLDGDGRAEIVTGAGPGGGPHVRVFNGSGGGLPGSAYAYAAAFTGGVLVAVGDVDGNGSREIITAAGPGGGPHIRTFDIAMQPGATSFYAYGPNFSGGVFVAAGRA